MNIAIVLGILQNIAILLAFSMLYDYVWVKKEETYKLWQKILNGLVIGCIGVVLMLTPWTFVEGIVFDTRSVLLSVSGLFFGPVPTIIAMFITGLYRVILGGSGMWMGIAVIITSGLIGIIWRQFNPVKQKKSYLLQLYLMGLIVHAVMLGCTIFLPSDRMLVTLKEIAATVILVYPVGTLLLGMLMVNRNKKWQIRRALKESQEKYKRLYESIKDAYIMLDLSGKIIEANPSFLNMLGYSNAELMTLNNKDITPEEWLRTESILLDQYLVETDSSPIYEKEYIRKDGLKLPVQLHTFLLKDDKGNAKAMWSIVRDISESKCYEQKLILAREKAEENDKLKTIFLANMSHEIRTPMNAIMGFSGLLADPGNPPEKINKYVEIIKSSGSHLMKLVDDIIDISKIESRQLKVEKKIFFPNRIIYEIVEIHNKSLSRYKDKDLTFEITVPAETEHLMLYSDPFRFRQIFSNLLGNAVKYSVKGKISAGYIMVPERNPEWLHFFVKDNGIGIDQKDLKMIFDRFTQVGRFQKAEGAGLGLSITKGLVELLGGAIWLESEIEKGSEFYFSLPYDPEIDAAISEDFSEKESAKIIQHFDFAGKTLYIAEDDDFSFFFIKEILADTRIAIKHAVNGEELLKMISENIPDLVLLDINMPVMNGYTCIRELRSIYSGLPVIAQTAYAMPGEREAILKAGCNAYISKPIDNIELKKLMNDIIG